MKRIKKAFSNQFLFRPISHRFFIHSIQPTVYLLVIFCLFTSFSIAKAGVNSLTFDAITNDKGLSHNTVYDICQDVQGFMWFATDEGLNRYDGKNIKQYVALGTIHSLPSNSIRSLVNTTAQQLFIGTANGLALYQPDKDNFVQLLHNKASLGQIIDIQEANRRQLLISTENKGAYLYSIDNNHFQKLDFLKERIVGMTKDKEGLYWAFSRFSIVRFNDQFKIISTYHVSPELFN